MGDTLVIQGQCIDYKSLEDAASPEISDFHKDKTETGAFSVLSFLPSQKNPEMKRIMILGKHFRLAETEVLKTYGLDLIIRAERVEIEGVIDTVPLRVDTFGDGKNAGNLFIDALRAQIGSKARFLLTGGEAFQSEPIDDAAILASLDDEIQTIIKKRAKPLRASFEMKFDSEAKFISQKIFTPLSDLDSILSYGGLQFLVNPRKSSRSMKNPPYKNLPYYEAAFLEHFNNQLRQSAQEKILAILDGRADTTRCFDFSLRGYIEWQGISEDSIDLQLPWEAHQFDGILKGGEPGKVFIQSFVLEEEPDLSIIAKNGNNTTFKNFEHSNARQISFQHQEDTDFALSKLIIHWKEERFYMKKPNVAESIFFSKPARMSSVTTEHQDSIELIGITSGKHPRSLDISLTNSSAPIRFEKNTDLSTPEFIERSSFQNDFRTFYQENDEKFEVTELWKLTNQGNFEPNLVVYDPLPPYRKLLREAKN